MYVNFKEDNTCPTAGVFVSKNGMNFVYNSKFIDSLSETELGFVILHEVLHLQYRHNFRVGVRDKKLSNIAMDMIINNIIRDEAPKQYATVPTTFKPYFIPKEYTGKLIYEDVYEYLKENEDE
jgi:predicted metal-dependent peptidase